MNLYSNHRHYLYHYHHLHYLYYYRHHHHDHHLKVHFPSVGPTGVCWAVDKGDAVWRRLGAKVIVWPRIGNVDVVVVVVVVVIVVVVVVRDIVAKTILKASTALNNWGQNQSIPVKHIWPKPGTQIWLKSILELKSNQNTEEVNQSLDANPTEIFRKSINAITNNANPTKIWRRMQMVVPTGS